MNSPMINVRLAQITDARAISSVHVAVWQSHYRKTIPDVFLDNLSVDKRLEHWQIWLEEADYGNKAIYVAECNDQIIGFISGGPCRDDEEMAAEFYAIYVKEEFQGLGAGKKLLEAFFTWCKEKAHRTICCWVLEENPNSRKFYEGMGGKLSEGLTKTLTYALKDVRAVRYEWKL